MATKQRLPGTDVIGQGYNATGHYANASSLTLPIFDLGPFDATVTAPNGKVYALPSSIKESCIFADMSHGSYDLISGETAEEYRKSLSVDVKVSGGYGLFSADVKAHFSKNEIASFNHTFVTLYHHYDLWTIGLPDISTLKMVPTVKADIDGTRGLSPSGVIRKYGTHVAVSAVIGGRARYTCFVDRSKYKSETNIGVAVEASYKGALKLDTSMETQHTDAVQKLRESAEVHFDTIGGEFKPDFNPTSFVDWMNSFKERPVLVDFTPRSLIEIYKLAANKQRRDELRDAFIQYIKDSEKLVPDDMPLLEIEVVPKQSVDRVGSDRGSGAKRDLALYRPKCPEKWYWLGQSGNCNTKLIRVKPLVPGVVTEPHDYQCAWTDAGSGKKNGYSLWNISPQPNYRALGGIARLGKGRTDWAKPKDDEVKGIACVHESLCAEGDIGGMIWNDAGTHAKADGSVWEIKPKSENGIHAHTFFCQDNHSRPNEKVYVIAKGPKVKLKDIS